MADNPLTKLPLGGQLGVSVRHRRPDLRRLLLLLLTPTMLEQETPEEAPSSRRSRSEIRALEVTANKLQEFQREVQLLEAQARDPEADPAAREGDARPDAAGPVPWPRSRT